MLGHFLDVFVPISILVGIVAYVHREIGSFHNTAGLKSSSFAVWMMHPNIDEINVALLGGTTDVVAEREYNSLPLSFVDRPQYSNSYPSRDYSSL